MVHLHNKMPLPIKIRKKEKNTLLNIQQHGLTSKYYIEKHIKEYTLYNFIYVVIYKGVPIRLSADFSKETLQARRGWKEVFEVMKGKDLHPRLLYPEKLSFRMEGQVKCFPDKVKLKEFIITKPLLYEMLKGHYLRKRRSKM